MCMTINYTFPSCQCIARIGTYTCYDASHSLQNSTSSGIHDPEDKEDGFSLNCPRYKVIWQEKRVGHRSCKDHFEGPADPDVAAVSKVDDARSKVKERDTEREKDRLERGRERETKGKGRDESLHVSPLTLRLKSPTPSPIKGSPSPSPVKKSPAPSPKPSRSSHGELVRETDFEGVSGRESRAERGRDIETERELQRALQRAYNGEWDGEDDSFVFEGTVSDDYEIESEGEGEAGYVSAEGYGEMDDGYEGDLDSPRKSPVAIRRSPRN